MTTPNLCPSCGQPLPHPPPKRGRRYTRADAPPASLPARLRALYGDGQAFSTDAAGRALGETTQHVSQTLARMKDAKRVDALRSPSGQWLGEWRLTTTP